MNQVGNWVNRIRGLVLVCVLLGLGLPARAADSLVWRPDQNSVDADIHGWGLQTLLEHMAAATGWQVFVEPDTKYTVSTKFKGRTPGEALRLLMPTLTAVLMPQSNAAPKLLVFRTSAQEATQMVRPPAKTAAAKAAKPIPNELVVTLKPGEKIGDLARRLGAKVVGRMDSRNAYRLQFDSAEDAAAARESLRTDSSVDSIDSNFAISQPPEAEQLAYSSAPPLSLKMKAVPDGDRVIVGLIDTAIQLQGGANDAFYLATLSVAEGANPDPKRPTHGTSMGETILRGVALLQQSSDGSRVRILPVDVYGSSPMTSTFQVAQGIVQAVNGGAMIINLSLGSDGNSSFLEQVIKDAHSQGVVFYAAAGNEPVATPTYPAAYPEVDAVTAIDRNGQIARYANYGSFVDVGAPGSTIVTYNGQSYLVMGTSASTAIVSGMAAGTVDNTSQKPIDVEPKIRDSLGFSNNKTMGPEPGTGKTPAVK